MKNTIKIRDMNRRVQDSKGSSLLPTSKPNPIEKYNPKDDKNRNTSYRNLIMFLFLLLFLGIFNFSTVLSNTNFTLSEIFNNHRALKMIDGEKNNNEIRIKLEEENYHLHKLEYPDSSSFETSDKFSMVNDREGGKNFSEEVPIQVIQQMHQRDYHNECIQLLDHEWKKVPCGGKQGDIGDLKQREEWCRKTLSQTNIKVGFNWGTCKSQCQDKWENYGCNSVAEMGRLYTCDEAHGLAFLESWKSKESIRTLTSMKAPSAGHCYKTYVGNEMCAFENVIVDYSKARPSGGQRTAKGGFVLVNGGEGASQKNAQDGVGFPNGIQSVDQKIFNSVCGSDNIEEATTLVISHDDIFNFGHHMSDMWNVWMMGEVMEIDWSTSQLVNIDGIYGKGPARNGNNLMVRSDPDHFSVFFDIYKSWFGGGIYKANSYGNERKCYRKIVFQPRPMEGHIWSDFGRISECSTKGPSWLYQNFNQHLRSHMFGESEYLKLPRPERPLIVFNQRKKKYIGNTENLKVAPNRVVANEEEFIKMMKSIPDVDVIVQDFATISFLDQMKLMSQTSVLVGFHGAGMAHLLSLPIGTKHCCSVVEMKVDNFNEYEQFGNQARYLGMTFYDWKSKDKSKTSAKGTIVDINALRAIIEKAVDDVRSIK